MHIEGVQASAHPKVKDGNKHPKEKDGKQFEDPKPRRAPPCAILGAVLAKRRRAPSPLFQSQGGQQWGATGGRGEIRSIPPPGRDSRPKRGCRPDS
jgi:hypothetical protein